MEPICPKKRSDEPPDGLNCGARDEFAAFLRKLTYEQIEEMEVLLGVPKGKFQNFHKHGKLPSAQKMRQRGWGETLARLNPDLWGAAENLQKYMGIVPQNHPVKKPSFSTISLGNG